ncbi:MAG: hypothetical protein M0004_07850 [Actinomycetota bacterium]|nr:hypothetical protein [Actinomycetota bacterium]
MQAPYDAPHRLDRAAAPDVRRVENHWEQGARAVVAPLEELVDEIHPRVVPAGGEARALERLRGALPRPLRERVHEIAGRRHPGAERSTAPKRSSAPYTAPAPPTTRRRSPRCASSPTRSSPVPAPPRPSPPSARAPCNCW